MSSYVTESASSRAAIADRLYQVSIRPPIVPVISILCALAAVMGPFRATAMALFRRSALPDEAGGYLANALGAASGFLIAGVLVPIGLFLLLVSFAAWTQRTWAWTAVAALLCVAGLAAALTFPSEPLMAVLRLAGAGVLAYFWYQPVTRKWYGAE